MADREFRGSPTVVGAISQILILVAHFNNYRGDNLQSVRIFMQLTTNGLKITSKTYLDTHFADYNLFEKVCRFKKTFINLLSANGKHNHFSLV